MGLVIDLAEVIQGQVGIPLGGRQTGVAQQFLDRTQVRPHFEEMGGERVTERVGGYFERGSLMIQLTVEDIAHPAIAQGVSLEIQEQRMIVGFLRPAAEGGTDDDQVILETFDELIHIFATMIY